jgi:hypothetical protein
VLTLYGVASAFIFIWVPWRGSIIDKGGNTRFLGYGYIWSQPRQPAAFVEHDKRLGESSDRGSPEKPKEPEGYISPFNYYSATIDYRRVFLEFGALTGLLLMAWMLTYAEGRSNES